MTRRQAIFLATLAAAALTLGGAAPASALGSGYASCYAGLSANHWSHFTYRDGFTGGGGSTIRSSAACFATSVSVQLRYRAYPGGPLYWSGVSYGTYVVDGTQGGTVGGSHRLINGGTFWAHST
jgi:hypothetical protein